tara:strand:- start:17897 stop:18583 length:687 start_codon:yes stop_codon:yes gene_type:complete
MILGIIAAAGKASRLNGIPKFLLPLIGNDQYLLKRTINILNDCGVDQINIGLSDYTKKIAQPFIDGLNITECSTDTMNETIQIITSDQADISICIMPDTYFDNPEGVSESVRLLSQEDSIASICIWKIRSSQQGSVGQVSVDSNKVVSVKDKDAKCNFPYVWGTVAWKKELNNYIDEKDPHIGYAVQKAVENGEKISYVLNKGHYFDCGTVEQYWKLINYITLNKEAD